MPQCQVVIDYCKNKVKTEYKFYINKELNDEENEMLRGIDEIRRR